MANVTVENDEGVVSTDPTPQHHVGASAEALPESLDLHSCLPTQVGVKSSRYQVVNPINSIQNAKTIEFQVQSAGDELIDPHHTYLFLAVRILGPDGAVIPSQIPDTSVGAQPNAKKHNPVSDVLLVNGVGHMLFQNCKVKLNDVIISHGDGMYAYRGDLETRLMWPEGVKRSMMQLAGFDADEDELSFDDALAATDDKGITWEAPATGKYHHCINKRILRTRDSKTHMVVSRIHSEIFEQPKFLPKSTRLYVAFDRQEFPNEFCILAKQAHDAQQYTIDIVKCNLLMRMVTVDEEVLSEIQTSGTMGQKYLYPIRRVDMSYFTKENSSDYSHPNLFMDGDALPRRIFIAFVKRGAFTGDQQMDPFAYQDLDIKTVGLRVGGEHRPYPLINIDRGSDTGHALLVFQLLDSTGSLYDESDIGISMDNYKKKSNILGFDLTNVKTRLGENYELPLNKSCDFELTNKFKNTRGVMSMIVYAEYDAEIEMDALFNVRKKNFGTAE